MRSMIAALHPDPQEGFLLNPEAGYIEGCVLGTFKPARVKSAVPWGCVIVFVTMRKGSPWLRQAELRAWWANIVAVYCWRGQERGTTCQHQIS